MEEVENDLLMFLEKFSRNVIFEGLMISVKSSHIISPL